MSPPPPLVTVVVPAYDIARFLPDTLRSIRAQTEQRWQCVVVDDGSSDGTSEAGRAAVGEDPRFTFVRTPNRGASAARNAGFRAAPVPTEWVTFMDGDDVWHPHALATLLAAAEVPGTIGAHGLAELVDENGRPVDPGAYPARGRGRLGLQGRRLDVVPPACPTDFDVLVNGNVLFPPGLVLARRTAYETVGPFDESLAGAEDWDMLIRLSRVGGLTFVDDVVLDYRRHGSNLGARSDVPRLAWRVRCIAFWSPENSADQQRRARRGWRAYQRRLRAEHLAQLREQAADRRFRAAAGSLAHAAVCAARGWRGFPLPRVVRAPLRW